MENENIFYFGIVWLTAAWAGVSRCVRNGDWKSFTHSASVFCVSGFLGFSVVAFFTDYRRPDFNHVFGVGIAAIVGLAGREQTLLISALWRKLLGTIDVREIQDSGVAGDSLGNRDGDGSGKSDKLSD